MSTQPLNWLRSLSGRIIGLSLLVLFVGLTMMGGTLWLSWQMEGEAAAINDAGSLRMRAYRLALALEDTQLSHHQNHYPLREEIQGIDDTLTSLSVGDPTRPLVMPNNPEVNRSLETVKTLWTQKMRPLALQALETSPVQNNTSLSRDYRTELEPYVAQLQQLVKLIESDNAHKTTWLRISQLVLIAMSIAGTVAIIYLLYLWIIQPVQSMQSAIGRMARKEFNARVPIESDDEFGELAQTFNHMAEQLSQLYQSLEQRVAEKTQTLEQQNHELSVLYKTTTFLNEPHALELLCQGFIEQTIQHFTADGGSLRLYSERDKTLHLVSTQGYSPEMAEDEFCLRAGDCHCGVAMASGKSQLYDLRIPIQPIGTTQPSVEIKPHCGEMGFLKTGIFQIDYQGQKLGIFTLHFKHDRQLSLPEQRLLQTLGQHLGAAIQTMRLSQQARELAIAQERNLVAQGLHDSIAQGLSYLNIQVQLLQESIQTKDWEQATEIVPFLQAGVQESYEDVRELLLDFRSKLEEGDIERAMRNTIDRFTRQTTLPVTLEVENDGPALPRDQQLQILFILQEALSNIRKHAQATQVSVTVHNHHDFTLKIRDNGCGFDLATKQFKNSSHVGLNIMRERANKISATLNIETQMGQGTMINLHLAQAQRLAA
ncbi:type IV pili methyl-accepting chemotaxis transducer N-terminal domain-containing protein [Parvibium lacunae]|uniref:Sensor protein n=1 Tax=Parvibium lacunae TaxID=1888893 RepID=A0A368L6W3_9BURK|nr:type IV pili methyl-accepting chemotaxis transducer N-terminal domain-containing protein [Parvibium lacunae]RCS59405.1 HAMP domain-containing protein [Parvibium lacunae]